MIRIAFICDSFELGGQELGCLAVMRGLDRSKFEPHLYTFRPGSLVSEAAALGVQIMVGYDKPASDDSWTDSDEAAREEYGGRLAARLRADAIDACLLYAWPDGIAAAQRANVRAIVERVDGVSLATRLSDKSACRRIICESKMIRDVILAQRQLLRCRREQLVVIENGIDLARFDPSRYDRERCRVALGLQPDDFAIGTVARLAPEKNLEHFLEAVALLIGKYGRWQPRRIRAVIAGPDAGSRAHLEAEAERLGVADRIRFLGSRSDVPEILRALDVFAITSLYEGTPFALLEAMAMGLPIVATHVGAIAEVINGNGYLVCVLHPEETARAMYELLASRELSSRLGKRSRKLAARYDVNRMVRRYESVLLDALSSTARDCVTQSSQEPA
ncbi:MAG TPA: glycosyltransferase [Candidatus Binataceae bacterium]